VALSGAEGEFELVREAVVAIRQARADYSIPPSAEVEAFLDASRDRNPEQAAQVLREEAALISRLAAKTAVQVGKPPHSGAAAHLFLTSGTEVVVPLAGVVDVAKECRRLRGELEQLEKQLDSLRQRLRNEGFVSRAPADVVQAERNKEIEWSKRRDQLADKVQSLCG
jgi:valyl-tRNA synthetase